MSANHFVPLRLPGIEPDPWQVRVLEDRHPRLLLNGCRQAGKSTVAALLALGEAASAAGAKVLLLSPSHRRSLELFRMVTGFQRLLDGSVLQDQGTEEIELANRSRILCLPGAGETVRDYANVSLLVIEEAARVPDDLYRALSPMLAVPGGRMVCLSTPYGKRGFFWDAWANGGADWHRLEVAASQVPRIPPEFLERQQIALGLSRFRQEYFCAFEPLAGLIYPNFARCVVSGPAPHGKKAGGMVLGRGNPFAAVWGVLDRHDVLWLTGEHYSRERSPAYQASRLPRDVSWYAGPGGARDIRELRRAGLQVGKADGACPAGIAAVRTRLDMDALRVVAGACPNLLAEAAGFLGGPGTPPEEPDHALNALCSLVRKIDAQRTVRRDDETARDKPAAPTRRKPRRRRHRGGGGG